MKPITFAELKRIQKMSLNEFNRWLVGLCRAMYQDGFKEGESEFDDCAIITEERLMEIVLSVKGVGRKRAEQIVNALLSEEISDGTEIGRNNEECKQKIRRRNHISGYR